jgi:hypothetical protein
LETCTSGSEGGGRETQFGCALRSYPTFLNGQSRVQNVSLSSRWREIRSLRIFRGKNVEGMCPTFLPVGASVSPHHFDLLAEQMAYELTQVETSRRTVASRQRRLIVFHSALAQLTAVFGMADQGLDA